MRAYTGAADAAPCWVYVLQCSRTGRYYVGSCEDVEIRLSEHNGGRVASTRAYGPWEVVHREQHPSRSVATRRERQIKAKKSRRWIEWHLLGRGHEGHDMDQGPEISGG